MTRDAKLIIENYCNRLVEAAQPVQTAQQKRLKDFNAFTSNLVAIDAFEDKTNEMFNVGVKTGFLTQTEANQAKQVIAATISGFLLSLVVSTEIKTPNQLQQMKKAISDKITGIDVKPVLSAIDKMIAGNGSAVSQQPQDQQITPQQPAQLSS